MRRTRRTNTKDAASAPRRRRNSHRGGSTSSSHGSHDLDQNVNPLGGRFDASLKGDEGERNLLYLYERHSYVNAIIKRRIDDSISPAPDILDGEDNIEDLEKELRLLQVWRKLQIAGRQAYIFGWSMMVMTIEGDTDMAAPAGTGALTNINVISPRRINDKHTDLERNEDITSARFGKVDFYNITTGTAGQKTRFHWTRVIHVTNWGSDENDLGVSLIKHIFDDATISKNIDFATGHAYTKRAGGASILHAPRGTPEDRLAELDDIAYLGDFNEYVWPQGDTPEESYRFEFQDLSSSMNPHDWISDFNNAMGGSTGVPISILQGTNEGKVTGSELNIRTWSRTVIQTQASLLEPNLRIIIKQVEERNGIAVPEDYTVDWPNVWEPTDMEDAQTGLIRAQAQEAKVRAITLGLQSGIPMEIDEEGELFIKPSTMENLPTQNRQRIIKVDVAEMNAPDIIITGTPWDIDTDEEEVLWLAQWRAAMEALETHVKTFVVPRVLDPNSASATNSAEDIDLFVVDPDPFRLIIRENMENLYIQAGINTAEIAAGEFPGSVFLPANPQNPEAIAFLNQTSILRSSKYAEETTDIIRKVLQEGLAEGDGVDDMLKRLDERNVFDSLSDSKARRIIRTEGSRAVNVGRLGTYEESGIVEVEFQAALDAEELCQALDGRKFKVRDAATAPGAGGPGIIPVHAHCRCTWVPVVLT